MVGATDQPLFLLEATYVRDLPELSVPWQAATAPDPTLLVLNRGLADELALDVDALTTVEGVATLVGNVVVAGSRPVAQAYAGHQFGGFSPRLGDGRALLLGELIDRDGHRRDLHLKGSGRTPFARGGDGKAAIGPMLREYVVGEAMHALGVPTTRALAVTATGEDIARDTMLPGAVLTRVAASHLRVGTFQFAANSEDPSLVQRLADHAIARHHPAALEAANPYLACFESVAEAQASLVSRWMLVGFIHGVMNTDNMTISGETIDYGPCAFMEAYDPATVFSSIDHGGRYAYGNQPRIAQWNLARLAETMLPLFADEQQVAIDLATEVLQRFPDRYHAHWRAGMRAKLGLPAADDDERLAADDDLANDLLALLHAQRVDLTSCMRALSASVRGDAGPARVLFAEPAAFDAWSARHHARVLDGGGATVDVAAAMDRVNPIYVPRNQQVEAALEAATAGDMALFHRLVDAISNPFDERPGLDACARPAPDGTGPYRTFCGT